MKLCVLGVKRNFNSNKLRDNQKKTKFDPYLANVKVLVTVHVNLNLTRTFPAIMLAFIDSKESFNAKFFRTRRRKKKVSRGEYNNLSLTKY